MKDVVICLGWRVAGGTAVVIAGFTAVESVASGEMIGAELGDKVAALAHFRVDAPEYIPVDGIEGSIIPLETIVIVGSEGR